MTLCDIKREFRNGLSLKDYAAHAIVGMGAAVPFTRWGIARADYLNSVAYLRAISLTCSRVSCFGDTPGAEQEQLVIGICEPMPDIFGNEYCCALIKTVRGIVQCKNSTAFQNVEGFVHPKVSVYRNARTDRHLLGSQGEIVGACGGADLDEDVAGVAPMNEMFAVGGAEHISM